MTQPSQTIDLADLGTTLTVWAHPDDESYLAAGLSAALRDLGSRVVCVTATRGEAADPAADARARAELAALRTRELEAALAVTGVREHLWLDQPDGGCADLDPGPVVDRLTRIIDRVRPGTVVTFGPEGHTGHPDHRAVSRWVDAAVRRSSATPRVLQVAVTEDQLAIDPQLNEDFGVFDLGRPRLCSPDQVALRLELDPVAVGRKVESLRSQPSQTAGLVAAVGLERFSAWVSVETFAWPEHGPDDAGKQP